MTRPEYASPCGLYCGICAILIAHRDNNEKFKQRLVALYKGDVPGKGGTLSNIWHLTTDDIQFIVTAACQTNRSCIVSNAISGTAS